MVINHFPISDETKHKGFELPIVKPISVNMRAIHIYGYSPA